MEIKEVFNNYSKYYSQYKHNNKYKDVINIVEVLIDGIDNPVAQQIVSRRVYNKDSFPVITNMLEEQGIYYQVPSVERIYRKTTAKLQQEFDNKMKDANIDIKKQLRETINLIKLNLRQDAIDKIEQVINEL